MAQPSSRRRSAWLLAATVVAASGLLGGCAPGDPQPEYPVVDGFMAQNAAFDVSLGTEADGVSLNLMADVEGDHVTFDGQQLGPAEGEEANGELELDPGQTGALMAATITLCDVWISPKPLIPAFTAREFWVYYAYSFDGTTPVCPERLN